MTSLLLIISFLLHLITIYALYFLYKQFQQQKKEDVSELTKLFDGYLQEIKEENIRLQQEIQMESTKDGDKLDAYVEKMEKAPQNENREDEPFIQVDHIKDSVEASLEAQVIRLFHEGLTITEIAKTLQCGKTEAELIINLHQKKLN